MGKTALMRDIVEGTLTMGSVSTLTSWHSVGIKYTTMQICTLHYPKDVTSGCPDCTFMILHIRVCRVLGEAFKRVLAGAMPWAALLVFGNSKSLQCPRLVWPIAGREGTEPVPIGAALGVLVNLWVQSGTTRTTFYARNSHGQVLLNLSKTGLGGEIYCQWLYLNEGWRRFLLIAGSCNFNQ